MSGIDSSRRSFLRLTACLPILGCVSSALGNAANLNRAPSGFGVNCFDLFLGPLLRQAGVRSAGARLQELAGLGVSFVRFPISVFWPSQWKFYREDQSRYFALLDELAWSARHHGIKLVPTFFWNISSVSDLCGEPVSAWGNPNSKTSAFADLFVEDLARRYSDDQFSVWEFANEANTYADIAEGFKWWPKVAPEFGTPSVRTPDDVISSFAVIHASARFSNSVRRLVPGAVLSGGFDAPRKNAYNLRRGKGRLDSPAEMRGYQAEINKDYDLLSLHVYPNSSSRTPMMLRQDYHQELNVFSSVAEELGKSVFVGEFGVQRSASINRDKAEFERLLDRIVELRIRAAALWVYDYAPMARNWSVTLDGDRRYQLELISKYQSKI